MIKIKEPMLYRGLVIYAGKKKIELPLNVPLGFCDLFSKKSQQLRRLQNHLHLEDAVFQNNLDMNICHFDIGGISFHD